MDDPELYHKAEHFKADMQNFFDEYKAKIRFRHDRKDSLLDIGCAGGNITIDVILSTLLPEGFSRLVGIDISRTMINYANEHFKLPNVSFEVLDIGGDITDFLATHQCFDHITSTLCLHLVPDQQRALQNIYNLLQPNGDCLLYIITDCFVFDAYGKMDKKWLKYMEDADDYISPYYRRLNPEYLLKKYLKNAGFTRYEIQMRKQYVAVDDVEKFKEFLIDYTIFASNVANGKEEFTEEFVDLCLEMTMEKNGEVHNGAGGKIDLTYTLMTAFAEKT